MAQYRISQDARADIVDVLRHSQTQFGLAARRRYQGLILTALDTIAAEPDRIGSSSRDEIEPGLRSFHLVHCRSRSPAGKVHRPRHILFYRLGDDEVIEVVRILHDAMEVRRHLSPE